MQVTSDNALRRCVKDIPEANNKYHDKEYLSHETIAGRHRGIYYQAKLEAVSQPQKPCYGVERRIC